MSFDLNDRYKWVKEENHPDVDVRWVIRKRITLNLNTTVGKYKSNLRAVHDFMYLKDYTKLMDKITFKKYYGLMRKFHNIDRELLDYTYYDEAQKVLTDLYWNSIKKGGEDILLTCRL
jgi:hypothetical protein